MPFMRAIQHMRLWFLGYKLMVLALNTWIFPRLKPEPLSYVPKVSLLIPARDEAENLKHTLPLLLNYQNCEIIVLNDASRDETATIVQELAFRYPQLRLVQGKPLPKGWMGKNWACWQLAQQATGEMMIFTDADVFWSPRGLQAVLSKMQNARADLLTIYPQQHTHTWAERLIVPLIDDVLLCGFPYFLVRLPFALASAANGQVMAFKRESYFRLGGHEAVKNEVLEDVKLARRMKAVGGRISVALGKNVIGVRMYHSYPEIIEGFGKNLRAFHGGSKILTLTSGLWHFFMYTEPFLQPKTRGLGLLGMLERLWVGLVSGRSIRGLWLEVLLNPLVPLLTLPIFIRSLKPRYRWKNREYQA